MEATREAYFNIQHVGVMYALLGVSLAMAGRGFWQRWSLWRRARPGRPLGDLGRRLRRFVADAVLQRRLLAHGDGPGALHLGLVAAFVVLLAGTTVCFIDEDLGLPIMRGRLYLYFQSLTLDLFGAGAVLALAALAAHRLVVRPARLAPTTGRDALPFVALVVVLLTGFVIEGARIELTSDPWAAWSPIGRWTGRLLVRGMARDSLAALHRTLWWLHLAIVLGLIAWLPYSKLLHAVAAPANLLLRKLDPGGALRPLDLAAGGPLGAQRITDFSWKDLLDLDACTQCGRCEEICPAQLSGQPLSPKRLIGALRGQLAEALATPGGGAVSAVSDAVLWSCTTCGSCVQNCPVAIEHVDKVVDLRRFRVLEESRFPAEYRPVFRNLETYGDPFGKGRLRREEWTAGLDVGRAYEDGPADVLFWVGCMAALYDERGKQTPIAAVNVLRKAGLRVRVLGNEERCCGDPARRMGNDLLYQEMAAANVERFRRYGIDKIVTHCPHCFNTLRNEYRALGHALEVVHLVELIAALVRDGHLALQAQAEGALTFHDPCYLGRHNGVFEAPREVLAAALGASPTEMARSKQRSLCCGAGGGNFWRGRPVGRRPEEIRIEDAIGTRTGGVVTSCPYCEVMLTSAVTQKGAANEFRVVDIVTLVDRAS